MWSLVIPHGLHGGVVQFDKGKLTPSGFDRTRHLDKPPQLLRAAVTRLQADHMGGTPRFLEYLNALNDDAAFARKNAGPDVLFRSEYTHQGGTTCDNCSEDYILARQDRVGPAVRLHYGTIASSNFLTRDAAQRDQVSNDLGGVLCFEMEAAGLTSFPCVVIRGICDYADSHKHKKWQPAAAAAAAACAKELLSVIPPYHISELPAAAEISQCIVGVINMGRKD
jgi:hypothetical protein